MQNGSVFGSFFFHTGTFFYEQCDCIEYFLSLPVGIVSRHVWLKSLYLPASFAFVSVAVAASAALEGENLPASLAVPNDGEPTAALSSTAILGENVDEGQSNASGPETETMDENHALSMLEDLDSTPTSTSSPDGQNGKECTVMAPQKLNMDFQICLS